MPCRQRQLETHLHLPRPAAVPGEYFGMSQAFPSVVESIASYGGIVCPNAHKLCKLNCQSCRRIGKPCRRDDSSMSRRNLPQADAAHDSCHCHCHSANCDCLNCVATNSVIPKRMQTNKLTHNYFELVSTSAHSLPSQEWVRLLLSLSIRIGDVWSSEWLGISRNFSNNEYDNYC